MSRGGVVGAATIGVLIAVVIAVMTAQKYLGAAPGIAIHEPAPRAASVPPSPGPPPVSEPLAKTQESGAPSVGPAGGPAEPATPAEIVVQVAGAVKHPGVYRLAPGARNDDAVKAAGGLAANANGASVNLAAHAQDGSQLYIKTRVEQPEGGAPDAITITSSPPVVKGAKGVATVSGRGSAGAAAGRGASRTAKLSDPSQGQVPLNTASSEELQKVRGIGPSMAEKIIAYREQHHGFHSVEDLLEISGVGAKTYAKIAPFVKIK